VGRTRRAYQLFTFGPKDYANSTGIWSGAADWADGAELKVVPGHLEGGDALPGTHNAAGFAPEHDPAELFAIAKRLMKNI
jgi:manganese catalase